MKVSYDERADVFYLIFNSVDHDCEYVEENGVIFRIDPENKSVVSCTIPRFSLQLKTGNLHLPFSREIKAHFEATLTHEVTSTHQG